MANAVAKIPFSASTQGQGIKIIATATPGTLIHTTGTSATIIDEVWLYMWNSDTADRLATVEFGGPTGPDQNIVVNVPTKAGLILAVPGLPLLGSGAASLTVKVFAASFAVVVVLGYVNRITP